MVIIIETIETVEAWNDMLRFLSEFDYYFLQSQYDFHQQEGFQALFAAADDSYVKVITHDPAVYRRIRRFISESA